MRIAFFGVWLLLTFQIDESRERQSRSIRFLFLTQICLVLIFAFESLLAPLFLNKPHPTIFPMRDIGRVADQIWSEHSAKPCPYTTGVWYVAGNAAIAMKDRPRVLFYWRGIDNPKTPPTGLWASDTDVNEKGGLVFWTHADGPPDYLFRRFPNAMVQPEPIVLPYRIGKKIPPIQIGVAIVPSMEDAIPPEKIP